MTTAQTQAEALRLDQAMQQADRAEEMAIKYGVGTSLGLEAYASAQTIRALHARIAELEAQGQEDARDAERYRFLRQGVDEWSGEYAGDIPYCSDDHLTDYYAPNQLKGEKLDAGIDVARAAQGGAA